MSPTDQTKRAAFIAGLRELADFLEATPAAPVPNYGADILVCTHGSDEENRAVVDQAAAVLAVAPYEEYEGRYGVTRSFGPVSLTVSAIPNAAMAAYYAHMSYRDNVQAGPADLASGDGSAVAA
ncbi:hypothetical protein ACSNOI_20405 [Actinomadura kijaniata]|uniref:hypothetical protein n=1 Tax=Actinomadura kijaniata TaxID=46161 RepID=UPI003F1C22A7